MDVFSTVAGMGLHGAFGAYSSADFGKKGMFAGGAIGAAGFLAGEAITGDDDSLGAALLSGMVSGSVQSAFSTAQELYAFSNPAHISNVSSVNTTTTATAMGNAILAPLTKEGRAEFGALREQGMGRIEAGSALMTGKLATPENLMTDMLRMGMASNDFGAATAAIRDSMGPKEDGSKKGAFAKVADLAKGMYNNTMEVANTADNRTGWFSTEPITLDVVQKDILGRNLDADGKVTDGPAHVEKVSLTGKESVEERMGMYIDKNKHAMNDMLGKFSEMQEMMGVESKFKTSDDLKGYLTNIESGAIGTYKELERAGFYGEDASLTKKAVGYGVETFNGSPAWARITDKQLTDGTASIENYTDAKGNPRARISGGGRAGRIAGIVADIAMGGVINAAGNAAMWAVAQPFKSAGNHVINSNNAVNPI